MTRCACGRRARHKGTQCLACKLVQPQPQRFLPRQQRPVAGDLAPHVIDAIYEQARQRQRRARWSA